MEESNKIEVSVIIPVYNEEKYIDQCVQSLLKQDYPKDKVEFIFVDGNSTDKTVEILSYYVKKYSNMRLLHNPNRTVPYSMNIGIDNAKGDYIIRLDGHSEYAEDYISKCVEYLEKTGADNVGGPMVAAGKNFIGKAVANIHHSPFGLGGGKFHSTTYEGFVDTVYLGAFKKSTLIKLGKYDERLTRNQDIELNSRIRKNGGKIYLTPNIRSIYYCRDSIFALAKQNFNNGKWNIYTGIINSTALSLRHFIPLIFVLSIALLSILSFLGMPYAMPILALDLGSYIVANLYFTSKISIKHGIRYFFITFILFFALHISYGLGSFAGLLTFRSIQKKWLLGN